MDPRILTEILEHGTPKQNLILGQGISLGTHASFGGGQYPALVDGPPGNIVEGMVYNVQTVEDGEKLAEYETRNYNFKPCFVTYIDGKEPATAYGKYLYVCGRSEGAE
ncbi:hypothetical protein AJ80_08169 [Polytolypa hystricis UAMH7299]|uniref:Gamma-glutamylcyclotransferase AIG2-like domain-containing protein n=1 Tax=Polytolypa hystricis (strain UAMH7299) TaxID=1447883 RepID=A0A2B7XBX1_POLH7|nr:hypothetical protein AJ80_08169 [Polytolypa hystricis UAMH7299]